MCGIFGHISKYDLNKDLIVKELEKRGPDGQGYEKLSTHLWNTDSSLHLFHSRLSILDLTIAASQPMHSRCGRYVLTYNGEIYNYLELKHDLEKLGHGFIGTSDTEVLLHCFMQWRESCFSKLEGIFSLAIYDRKEDQLFLARDHFGVKPLYLFEHENIFAFSSEISPLIYSGIFSKTQTPLEINTDSLEHYLNFGSTKSPDTMIKHITSFPPGHYGIISKKQLKVKKYWSLESSLKKSELSYEEACSFVKEKLISTTQKQLRSDVEVGVLLSGGIDSGILTALASKHNKKSVKTFSIGFSNEGSDINELSISKLSARKNKTEHHEVIIGNEEFLESIDEFCDAIDQPSTDGLNSFFVSKVTAKYVKVALSGLGADEFFAGYPIFHHYFKNQKLPKVFQSLTGKNIGKIFNKLGIPYMGVSNDLKSTIFDYRVIRPQYTPSNLKGQSNLNLKRNTSNIQNLSLLESSCYMRDTLLRDVDAVSMHNSLEVRVPYLDFELAQFVVSLPDEYKFNPKYNKPLLVEPFKDDLVQETYSHAKRGFEMPVGNWIQSYMNDSLKNDIYDLQAFGIQKSYIQNSFNYFEKYPANYRSIWKLIILTKWLKKHNITPSGAFL